MHDHDIDNHDRGLAFDLSTMISRRRALQIFGVTGLAALVGCGSSTSSGSTETPESSATSTASDTSPAITSTPAATAAADEIPEETAGPFPADGSNGPNVLTESGIVRGDITSSFGSSSGTAEGVPLTINLTILDVAKGGTPVAGAAVYLWHCDRDGNYSLYSQGVTDQNYLRGVQEAGSDGRLTFTSIFPGAYPGRWPHIHFEVYPSLAEATAAGSKLVTSQLAFPEDICRTVYATAGYEASARNLSQGSLDSDNVFRDGYSTQLVTVTEGSASAVTVALNVGV